MEAVIQRTNSVFNDVGNVAFGILRDFRTFATYIE